MLCARCRSTACTDGLRTDAANHTSNLASRQDVAVALGAEDPLSVPDGVRRLVAVIKAVPRLQSFVSDVCKVDQMRTRAVFLRLPTHMSVCHAWTDHTVGNQGHRSLAQVVLDEGADIAFRDGEAVSCNALSVPARLRGWLERLRDTGR